MSCKFKKTNISDAMVIFRVCLAAFQMTTVLKMFALLNLQRIVLV